jgi:anti-sigma factor RsiW
MKTVTCRDTRRQLQAFHDRELPLADLIAVGAHLQQCGECAVMAAELSALGGMLRTKAPGRAMVSAEETASSLTIAVVSRLQAEHDASFRAWLQVLFDDMHVVYAGLGAAAATLSCVIVLLSIFRFGTAERPDSLAAMVSFLATPGAGSAAPIDDQMQTRWTERFRQANETAEQDAVFTLSVVVTRGGRHGTVEHLRHVQRRSPGEADLIEGLLDAVSRARLDSSAEHQQMGSNMVWLVTQMTVRAAKTQAADLPLPPAPKKRVASQIGHPEIVALV